MSVEFHTDAAFLPNIVNYRIRPYIKSSVGKGLSLTMWMARRMMGPGIAARVPVQLCFVRSTGPNRSSQT